MLPKYNNLWHSQPQYRVIAVLDYMQLHVACVDTDVLVSRAFSYRDKGVHMLVIPGKYIHMQKWHQIGIERITQTLKLLGVKHQ